MALGLGIGLHKAPVISAAQGLLDTYAASAAYSLRKLKGSVTNVARVRRSSDNAESDFSQTDFTDGTVAAWVGAGINGMIVTWYDQSGNGKDATQSVASEQGVVVLSGTLNTDNGKPACVGDGVSHHYDMGSAVAMTGDVYTVAVCSADVSGNMVYGHGASQGYLWVNGNTKMRMRFDGSTGGKELTTSNIIGSQHLLAARRTGTTIGFQVNNDTEVTGTEDATQGQDLTVSCLMGGFNSPTYHWDGPFQELILFGDAPDAAGRSAILSDVNDYYSIY